MTAGRTPLVAVPPGASAEQVAALVAVVSVLETERAAVASAVPRRPGDELNAWVAASRVSARRGSFTRGPWRLAGRLARRARA